jgi:UDP-MurNAc hydroxylase
MKLKLYRSSTVGIHSNNVKILIDPWLVDGEYYGSWSHFPFFDFDKYIDEINSYDLIYISHIHPDHCSKKTLSKINKKIPIYIHKYHEQFLKFNLEKLGFKVIEIEHGKRTKIKNNLHINIFAADNCDPQLCYKFSGCANLNKINGSQQIDSLSVIDDNKFSILNINDSPYDLAKSNFPNILKMYGKIDLMLTGYCGAGPFPQCIENFDIDQKIKHGEIKKSYFLNQAFNFIKVINAKYFLPFAGTYSLTGKLSKLQNLRGVPSLYYAYDVLDKMIEKNKFIETKSVKLNYDEVFDLSTGETENLFNIYQEDNYKKYFIEVLSKKKLDYEVDAQCSFDEIYELSKKSLERFIQRKLINNVHTDTNIIIDSGVGLLEIDNINNKLNVLKNNEISRRKKYVKYTLDSKLLKKILMGPRYAHWNNAEIGSHIKFFRNPNIFERNIYESMCFFHA